MSSFTHCARKCYDETVNQNALAQIFALRASKHAH